MTTGFNKSLKMWFRLALLIASAFVIVEGTMVIAAIAQGQVPKTPTNFWGNPFD
jgi:hypothetical protein